jgi:hypothetical protein
MRQVFAVIVVLALPLAAQDAQPVKQADSPLVAASKRANRKGKKVTNVITNDMIRQTAAASAGHVTTTTVQAPVPRLPEPIATPEMEAIAARNAERAKVARETEEKKKAEDKKKARMAAMRAAAAEGELYDDAEIDAAQFEEAAGEAAQQKPPVN